MMIISEIISISLLLSLSAQTVSIFNKMKCSFDYLNAVTEISTIQLHPQSRKINYFFACKKIFKQKNRFKINKIKAQ